MCPPGFFAKHFEKLIQCDHRLNVLSQQPEIVLDSPYFEPSVSVFDEPDISSHLKSEEQPVLFDLLDGASSSDVEPQDFMNFSPISEIRNMRAEETKMLSLWDRIKFPGLHSSMSMNDLANHIGHCISEQRTSGGSLSFGTDLYGRDVVEEITRYLFSDSQLTSASDEKSLISRVNSLCCLLQKDSTATQSLQETSSKGVNIIIVLKLAETNSEIAFACESKVGRDFSALEGG